MTYLMPYLSALLSMWTTFDRPQSATCQPGFYVNGIRPTGATECIQAPIGRGDDECVAGGRCSFDVEPVVLPVQLRCDRGTEPRVIDSTHVRCVPGAPT